jgi:ribonuclease HII
LLKNVFCDLFYQNEMLKLKYQNELLEVGTDEAGRGCLCGPVVAAAVILPDNFEHPFLNDSKQLTEKKREELRSFIEKNAIAWSVSFIDEQKIDKINI